MGIQAGVPFIVQAAAGLAANKSGLCVSPLTFFKLTSFVTYSNLLLLSPNNGLSTPS